MDNLDRQARMILSQIDSKPYRLYTINDLLLNIDECTNQNITKEFESRLTSLNDERLIYKVKIKEKTYYFSPKAETDKSL